ncbi:hypothetical protein KEM56_007194, partial [Ascosphaera pollenicola]
MQLIKNTIFSLALAAVVSAGDQQGSVPVCPGERKGNIPLEGVCYLKVDYIDKTATKASTAGIGAYDPYCKKIDQNYLDTKAWNVKWNLTVGWLDITKGTTIKGFNFRYGRNGHSGEDVYVNSTDTKACYYQPNNQTNHCWVSFDCSSGHYLD